MWSAQREAALDKPAQTQPKWPPGLRTKEGSTPRTTMHLALITALFLCFGCLALPAPHHVAPHLPPVPTERDVVRPQRLVGAARPYPSRLLTEGHPLWSRKRRRWTSVAKIRSCNSKFEASSRASVSVSHLRAANLVPWACWSDSPPPPEVDGGSFSVDPSNPDAPAPGSTCVRTPHPLWGGVVVGLT